MINILEKKMLKTRTIDSFILITLLFCEMQNCCIVYCQNLFSFQNRSHKTKIILVEILLDKTYLEDFPKQLKLQQNRKCRFAF